jgi:hypothetical protein
MLIVVSGIFGDMILVVSGAEFAMSMISVKCCSFGTFAGVSELERRLGRSSNNFCQISNLPFSVMFGC